MTKLKNALDAAQYVLVDQSGTDEMIQVWHGKRAVFVYSIDSDFGLESLTPTDRYTIPEATLEAAKEEMEANAERFKR